MKRSKALTVTTEVVAPAAEEVTEQVTEQVTGNPLGGITFDIDLSIQMLYDASQYAFQVICDLKAHAAVNSTPVNPVELAKWEQKYAAYSHMLDEVAARKRGA